MGFVVQDPICSLRTDSLLYQHKIDGPNKMTAREIETMIKDRSANPAPLGLMGFGMTTILLSLHNAGYIPLGAAILAMGIFFGGIAQLTAGPHGMEEGQHLRDDRVRVVRLLLDHHGRHPPRSQDRVRFRRNPPGHGLAVLPVGRVLRIPDRWHDRHEPGVPDRSSWR